MSKAWLRNTRRIALVIALGFGAVASGPIVGGPLGGAPVLAQDSGSSEEGEEDSDEMSEEDARKLLQLIKQGNRAYDAGEYAEAYKIYSDAYERFPNAALLYRLAKTTEKQDKIREAVDYYERFADKTNDAEAEQRIRQEVLPALRARLPVEIEVLSKPEGAKVFVNSTDGEPVGVTPFTGEVPRNTSRIIVTREGYQSYQKDIDFSEESAQRIDITLAPIEKQVAADDGPTDGQTDAGASNLSTWGITTIGIGAAVLATGGVFTLLQSQATNEVNTYDKRGPGASREELADLKDRANSYYTTSLILYVSGGVIVAAGTGLLVRAMTAGGGEEAAAASEDPDEGARDVQVGVMPTRGGAFFGIQGRF
jgi:tetratricopeptide (TPR) repeat protein